MFKSTPASLSSSEEGFLALLLVKNAGGASPSPTGVRGYTDRRGRRSLRDQYRFVGWMRKIVRVVRELTAMDVLFTPHPPINRSPFSHWRRLIFSPSLATLFSLWRRLFGHDLRRRMREEQAPPLRGYADKRTVGDAGPYKVDAVFSDVCAKP